MVYVYLAEGFEEVEALTVVDYVRRAGIGLKTVGIGGKIVTGSHGIPVTADLTMEEATADAEMIVLPGGMPGTNHLKESEFVRKTVCECAQRGGFVAAICAAPSVLGAYGLLNGKRATCYPGFEDALDGAEATGAAVVRDGRVITAKAAGAAAKFAYAIIEALADHETAEKIRTSVYDG